MKELDIDNWARKEHFQFFKDFDEPFFGATVSIDCTAAYTQCRQNSDSFFLYYLYQSMRAANAVEPFKYRLKDGKVLVFDQVDCSATIQRPDGTFGFAYLVYHEDPSVFVARATREIERIRNGSGLFPPFTGENVIHYSAVPWVDFTALSHARKYDFQDSCPKISFGKVTEREGRKKMAVSIHVHHALMDGLHVGKHLELFQEYMNGE